MNFQPKNMLVTGGAGFIGCNFIRFILQHFSHINIVNLDKLTYAGSLANLHDILHSHYFVQGDIADKELVLQLLLQYDIDTIVHFAAESHVDRSIDSPDIFMTTNVLGTLNLLNCAHYVWLEQQKRSISDCRFHHISTDEVYGSLGLEDKPFTELTPYNPRSPYAASKAASDHIVSAYFHTYGLPITISNCSNNYGPYQHQEKFIPTVVNACLNLKKIPIYGNGKNRRDWIHVEDHCRGIMAVIQAGIVGEKYNLGSNNEWGNLELAKYICQLLNTLKPAPIAYENLIEFVTDRPGHDFRYAVDSKKATQTFNWQAKLNFERGLQKYLASSTYGKTII